MKRLLILALCVAIFIPAASAQPTIVKETHTFVRNSAQPLRLDKYDIPGGQNKPCVIFMFGGGFVGGTRDDAGYIPYFHYLIEQGYTVISIDYRLGMQALANRANIQPLDFVLTLFKTVNDAAVDLFEATRYVLKHAEQWGIDPDMIVTCGSSAGAVSVLQAEYLICTGAGAAKQYLPAGFNYAGVISFAGAVLTMDQTKQFTTRPCPIALFHGDADSNVPYDRLEQFGGGFYGSKVISEYLKREQYPFMFVSFENFAHEIATTPMTQNREEVLSFLNKFVKQKQQLIIETTIQQIGKPTTNKDFKIEDFINSNFSN